MTKEFRSHLNLLGAIKEGETYSFLEENKYNFSVSELVKIIGAFEQVLLDTDPDALRYVETDVDRYKLHITQKFVDSLNNRADNICQGGKDQNHLDERIGELTADAEEYNRVVNPANLSEAIFVYPTEEGIHINDDPHYYKSEQ